MHHAMKKRGSHGHRRTAPGALGPSRVFLFPFMRSLLLMGINSMGDKWGEDHYFVRILLNFMNFLFFIRSFCFSLDVPGIMFHFIQVQVQGPMQLV